MFSIEDVVLSTFSLLEQTNVIPESWNNIINPGNVAFSIAGVKIKETSFKKEPGNPEGATLTSYHLQFIISHSVLFQAF